MKINKMNIGGKGTPSLIIVLQQHVIPYFSLLV